MAAGAAHRGRGTLLAGTTLLLGALAGCSGGGGGPAPLGFAFPSSWDGRAASPVILADDAWWRRLEDPVLDALVARALDGSLDLALARERVAEAQAARESVPGAALLSPSARAGVSGSASARAARSGTAELGLSWLLDPWGGRRDRLRAAEAEVAAAAAEVDAARLLLLAEMSGAYLDLRYRQRLAALAESELAARQDTLALTRTLRRAEEATRLETVRAEARVAEIRSELPGLRAAAAAAANQIAVLAGDAPGALPADLAAALAAPAGQPVPDLTPDVGIPADLLRNRPDLRIAEARYVAAVAETGAAEAALYPTLSLTGLLTLDVVGEGLDYFLGPSLVLPALPDDAGRAAVRGAASRARQAHGIWRQTVLEALLEVENALVRYDAASTAAGAADEAARLHRETRALTRRIYEEGEATLGDLVDAEEAIAAAERRLAALRLERAQAFVALNVGLGAGHSVGVATAAH